MGRDERKRSASAAGFFFVLFCSVLQGMGRHINEGRKLTNNHFKPACQVDFEFSSLRRVSCYISKRVSSFHMVYAFVD